MIYTGSFVDLDNVRYSVDIITESEPNKVVGIELGDNPVITSIEEGDHIFKPVKYSSTTINILTHDLLLNIYSSKAHGTKIIFKKGSIILWVGYITPNLYNQDYNYDIENLEIECIDGLSTLQYYDYESLGPISKYGPGKKFRSFTEIITHLIKKCECYKYVYFTAALQEAMDKKENIFDFLKVTEMNFFDEDNEPMKCDEVLEEICKFAGVTAVAQGDSVYLLNYESLDRVSNDSDLMCKYYMYNLADDSCVSKDKIDIRHFDYHMIKQNTLVSLGPTFNKIKVIDSLYSVDSVFPDLDDKKLLVNKNGADWSEYRLIRYSKSTVYDSFFKFYNHPNFECFHYNLDGTDAPNADVKTYDDLDNYLGGNIMKVYAHKLTESNVGDTIPSLNYKTCIYVDNQHHKWNPRLSWYPAVRTKIDHEVALNDKYAYLVLDGSVIFNTKNLHIPADDSLSNSFKEEDLYIECVLKYGDKIYDDTIEGPYGKGGWIDESADKGSTFKIYLDCAGLTDLLFNKSFNFKTNISYTMGLETSSGYAIKLPVDYYTTEAPVLIILQPRHRITQHADVGPTGHAAETGFFLNDFSCDIQVAYNESDDKELDSDTKYENVINEAFVNDFEDEEFKVCTWDEKQANYSAVIYDNTVVPPGGPFYYNTNAKYVDKLYNIKDYARSEELFIKKIIRQYSNPPIILDTTIHVIPNCYTVFLTNLFGGYSQENPYRGFIVDSYEINWRYISSKVKLNEIKL